MVYYHKILATQNTITMKLFVALSLLISLALQSPLASGEFLRVSGKDLMYGNQKVFLSGANIAWKYYGYDFGNNQYQSTGPDLERWVREIAQAGGNSIRIWIHCEGEATPQYDANGFVTAPDNDGTLISELSTFLDVAAANNVFVIPVLWNGALMRTDRYKQMIMDQAKTQSYLDRVLVPLVRALKDKPALGAWEVMNEPEGSVLIAGDSNNPCFDTSKLGQYGAGWTGNNVPMRDFLRFINKHSAVIKREDPKALVTLGSWSEHPQSDSYEDTYNYYKDSCLIAAGGEQTGVIDFYQMHTYSWDGNWNPNGPFKVTADSYSLDKPLVIGEFSSACAVNEGVDALWDYAYNNGYDGLWSWQYNAEGHCTDTQSSQTQGMQHIRNYNNSGAINVGIN